MKSEERQSTVCNKPAFVTSGCLLLLRFIIFASYFGGQTAAAFLETALISKRQPKFAVVSAETYPNKMCEGTHLCADSRTQEANLRVISVEMSSCLALFLPNLMNF